MKIWFYQNIIQVIRVWTIYGRLLHRQPFLSPRPHNPATPPPFPLSILMKILPKQNKKTDESKSHNVTFNLLTPDTAEYNTSVRLGESLFTLFASLTYAHHYLMTLIK